MSLRLSLSPVTLPLCLIVSSFLFFGCSGTKIVRNENAVFFPEPPSPPRVQFLHSYTGSLDVVESTSSFDTFLVGRQQEHFELVKPFGAMIQDGKIYICDTQASLMVIDLDNKTFRRMEGARGLGKVIQPMNVSGDGDGNKFVSDPVRGEVLMYDKNDLYVKSFGLAGYWKPLDTAAYEGLLYVADAKNRNITVFDIKTAKKLRQLGQQRKEGNNLGLPTSIAIGPDGLLYISDAARFQIVIMDRDGHELSTIGRSGVNLGHFARPRGVAVDRNGHVYVADGAFENVQIFRKDGQLLLPFGGSGALPGHLFLPAGVSIDYDNVEYFQQYADPRFKIEFLIIVVSQFGERLVNIYGFGVEEGRTYPTDKELADNAEKKIKKWQDELRLEAEDNEDDAGTDVENKKK